ncbi:MAG: hypothetical protein AVDCRST_MAG02-2798, partial [uncultured Rubrobacteraceae bacterium]
GCRPRPSGRGRRHSAPRGRAPCSCLRRARSRAARKYCLL